MKPEGRLPGDLQRGQRRSVITGRAVTRGVACATNLAKQLSDFARENALILKFAQQVVLRLCV